MKLTLDIIKNFSIKEYLANRKDIISFYVNNCPKRKKELKCKKQKKYYLLNRKTISTKNRIKYQEKKIQIQKEKLQKLRTKQILNNLRSRISHALKRNSKFSHTLALLGCSIEDFKKYLESKFKSNMSWENYGVKGWHIDHIKPCASFDLTNIEEQKRCFHYTNLQPLWAGEKLRKGSKVNFNKS